MSEDIKIKENIERLGLMNRTVICEVIRAIKTMSVEEIDNLENEINSLEEDKKEIVLEILDIVYNLQEENIIDWSLMKESVIKYAKLKFLLT
ncbi:hypothetical protein [Clostridium butyricum]|uniref:hypothetical protein n=1 Tax=Clostridium butyricum TaxID=1492 RepID=UPI002AB08F14|nr:hypothetical protein [Clostridium butyricum]